MQNLDSDWILPLYTSCKGPDVFHWVWHQGTQPAHFEEWAWYVPGGLGTASHPSKTLPESENWLLEKHDNGTNLIQNLDIFFFKANWALAQVVKGQDEVILGSHLSAIKSLQLFYLMYIFWFNLQPSSVGYSLQSWTIGFSFQDSNFTLMFGDINLNLHW